MPTALELKREEWQRFKGKISDASESQKLTIEEQRERDELLIRIRELAKALKNRFGARRVVLFGSIARNSRFTTASDVDLGVEGLKTNEYWRAWKLAEDYIVDRRIDFVDIETVTESLKRAIDQYGIEL